MKLGDTGIDTQAEPNSMDFSSLPKGRYKQQIISVEVVDKDSGSIQVALEGEILAAPYEGRKVKTWITIRNRDESRNQIGNGQISALFRACGFDAIQHDEQKILGIPHIVALGIDGEYNKMTGFFPLESAGKQELQKKVKEQGAFDARNAGSGMTNEEEDNLPF